MTTPVTLWRCFSCDLVFAIDRPVRHCPVCRDTEALRAISRVQARRLLSEMRTWIARFERTGEVLSHVPCESSERYLERLGRKASACSAALERLGPPAKQGGEQ